MPYVDRDEAGHITGIYECAQREGQEFVENAEIYVPALTIEERVALRLAERGLTLATEWQLYGNIAGTLALGALQGKTQAQLYAENTGFRNAMNMYTDIMSIRSGA